MSLGEPSDVETGCTLSLHTANQYKGPCNRVLKKHIGKAWHSLRGFWPHIVSGTVVPVCNAMFGAFGPAEETKA